MKRINILLTAVLALAAGFSSCDDDLAQPPVNLPEGGVGTGAWDSPMTAYQASLGSFNAEYPEPWVKGYIVGYIDTNIANVLKDETAKFTADGAVATNMLIAMSPDEKDWKNCATVQLPSGPVRNALNLSGNPGNLGKLVCIKGTTGSKYCSAYGVRSVSAFNWGEVGIDTGEEPTPPTPDVPAGETIYSALPETADQIDWTFDNTDMPAALSYIWSWKDYNGKHYLNASAYMSGTANASTAYAYSPVISLEGYKTAAFTFDHAAKFQTTIKQLCKAVIREAGTTQWTELEIPVWPGTTGWTFVSAGTIDIDAFAGKKVEIGFKYASTAEGADTWEIKNVKVTGTK